jgi:hypothetical protein
MNTFISYRREDSQYIADRVRQSLVEAFGQDMVFKDVDSIPLGLDFTQELKAKVGQCDALLAVIGPDWLTAAKPDGTRRLDDPHDWVRLEIEAALHRQIPVIPLSESVTLEAPAARTARFRGGVVRVDRRTEARHHPLWRPAQQRLPRLLEGRPRRATSHHRPEVISLSAPASAELCGRHVLYSVEDLNTPGSVPPGSNPVASTVAGHRVEM